MTQIGSSSRAIGGLHTITVYVVCVPDVIGTLAVCIRLILIVGLTNSQGSNLYQNCSLVNLHLEWDLLVIDLKVPGE